jgi:hypothetical protein
MSRFIYGITDALEEHLQKFLRLPMNHAILGQLESTAISLLRDTLVIECLDGHEHVKLQTMLDAKDRNAISFHPMNRFTQLLLIGIYVAPETADSVAKIILKSDKVIRVTDAGLFIEVDEADVTVEEI